MVVVYELFWSINFGSRLEVLMKLEDIYMNNFAIMFSQYHILFYFLKANRVEPYKGLVIVSFIFVMVRFWTSLF